MTAAAILVFVATPAIAAELANAEKKTNLALQGYDPVAFFTDGGPREGLETITAHRGKYVYRFATEEHRALFEANPEKYEPAFGGFCAYGVSRGNLAPVEIETWQIQHGRLILNKNPKVKELYNEDPEGCFVRATEKWPGLVEKHGE
jgi:hypothetical protein